MKNFFKSYIVRKIVPSLLILILVIAGIIKIDLINTKALSPLGNTNENYKLISAKFGKDFSDFIKDNACLKIYKENENSTLVRLGNKELKITNQSIFLKQAENIFGNIENGLGKVKQIIDKIMDKV